jgi:hypothetical protein
VPAKVLPFEAVREKLREKLALERSQARLKELVGRLVDRARIEIDEAALTRIK